MAHTLEAYARLVLYKGELILLTLGLPVCQKGRVAGTGYTNLVNHVEILHP